MNNDDRVADMPIFGIWVDREDMRDSAAWIRKERDKWQRWRGELADSDALVELLAEHASEVSKENLSSPVSVDELASEREFWYQLAAQGLALAYGNDEPEYTLDMIREPNPEYKP